MTKDVSRLRTKTLLNPDDQRIYYHCLPKSRATETLNQSIKGSCNEGTFFEVRSAGLAARYRSLEDAPGQIILTNHVDPSEIRPNRHLREIGPKETGGFDSKAWISQQDLSAGPTPTRLELFTRFLHEYNLIGMSKAEVERLLPPDKPPLVPNNQSFLRCIVNGDCAGDDYIDLDINFIDDKVLSWNFTQSGKKSKSFTENVVIVPEICSKDELEFITR